MFSQLLDACAAAVADGVGRRRGARRRRGCRQTIRCGSWSSARSRAASSQGPVSIALGAQGDGDPEPAERLLMCHAIEDTGRALPRGDAGGAQPRVPEPRPLDPELLAQACRTRAADGRRGARGEESAERDDDPPRAAQAEARRRAASRSPCRTPSGGIEQISTSTKHVKVIADEIRRLDQVVVGFLKFARPDELRLQPVQLASIISEVVSMSAPEAEQRGITVRAECSTTLPDINADPGMLQQAVLNLALNACQAMPNGGTLKLSCRTAAARRVEIDVEDTGVGIPPENLGEDLRSVFHDEGHRHRHRPFDGLPHRPAARRRGRGRVDPRPRHAVPSGVPAGVN